MPMIRVYNYPWAGRLRIHNCCLVCGDKGPNYQISSRRARCMKHYGDHPEKTELVERAQERYERAAREWCFEHGLDYYAVVRQLWEEHDGPPDQWRDEPKARDAEVVTGEG